MSGDLLASFREAQERLAALPPRPRCFMASHSVPYGRVFRQWNTRGDLLVWVNRGEIADPARRKDRSEYGIAPNAIDTAALMAIPVVNA